MAEERLPVQVATRALGTSESGFYAWRTRAPSARSIRHVILTDAIREVHATSHGVYGVRRVHAELTLGRGLTVWHRTVSMLMQRAGLKGIGGRLKWRRPHRDLISTDLVDRQFRREGLDELGVTDITEHHTRELLDRQRWRTRLELASAIFEYLEIFHNRQRRHSALGWLTPLGLETRQPITVAQIPAVRLSEDRHTPPGSSRSRRSLAI